MKTSKLMSLAGLLTLGVTSTAASATAISKTTDGVDVVIATASRPAVRPDMPESTPRTHGEAAETQLQFGNEHKFRLFSRAGQAAAEAIGELEISLEPRDES